MKTAVSGFGKQIALAAGAAWAVAAYPLYAYGSAEIAWSAVVSCGVVLANAVAGGLTAIWAFDKPHKTFLKAVLGGLGARLLGMVTAFGLLILYTDLHTAGLTFSLFGFYVLFQVVELRFLVENFKGRKMPEGA